MITLIGSPKTRAFRALWMLEELGVEYELIDAQPRSKEALAVNPSGGNTGTQYLFGTRGHNTYFPLRAEIRIVSPAYCGK